MHRPRHSKPIALVAGAAVLAGGGAAAIAQGQATTPTPAQDIALRIPKLSNTYVDTKPKGASTGDRFLDYAKVVDAKSGAARGYAFQACDLARLGKKNLSNCSGGVQLAGGRISFADTGTDEGRFSHTGITGGSGIYSTARGTITFDAGKKETGKNIGVAIHIEP